MHIFGFDMPRLHAILNDLPAALLTVAVLFDFAAWGWKRESLRWAALWTLWAGVIGGWLAVIAGLLASDVIEHGEAIHELMETHRTLALITMVIFTAILGFKLIRRFVLTPAEELILRVLSVAGFALLLWTGDVGGDMMFEHAAGIPAATMQTEIKDRAAGHHHHDGDADDDDHDHAAPADTTHPDTGHVHAPGTAPHTH
ncbi:MAG TPA: DUF2231 domain-containing protein [Gemmatimonadales bacterium]